MTYEEWEARAGISPVSPEAAHAEDAYMAGAAAMLETLIDRGYIAADYADIARKGVADLTGGTP